MKFLDSSNQMAMSLNKPFGNYFTIPHYITVFSKCFSIYESCLQNAYHRKHIISSTTLEIHRVSRQLCNCGFKQHLSFKRSISRALGFTLSQLFNSPFWITWVIFVHSSQVTPLLLLVAPTTLCTCFHLLLSRSPELWSTCVCKSVRPRWENWTKTISNLIIIKHLLIYLIEPTFH